jgi:hypothetical protein
MAGLQALGGQACELEPPPPTPVTHLKDLGGGHHGSRPNVTAPAAKQAPAKRAPTPDVTPAAPAPDVAPAPEPPDVAPDVVPPTQPIAPDAGPPAGDGPEAEGGASTP